MAQAVVGDAKVSLVELSLALGNWRAEDVGIKNTNRIKRLE